MDEADPFGLTRFVEAHAPVLAAVRAELAAGRKRSQWMWFVFPQISGLGSSPMSRRYAIGSRAEAEAFLAHEVLGARLRDLTALVNAIPDGTARSVFGEPDDLKFRSCMTLFAEVAKDPAPFDEALRRWFGGAPDPATLALLLA